MGADAQALLLDVVARSCRYRRSAIISSDSASFSGS